MRGEYAEPLPVHYGVSSPDDWQEWYDGRTADDDDAGKPMTVKAWLETSDAANFHAAVAMYAQDRARKAHGERCRLCPEEIGVPEWLRRMANRNG
jgi:hypothetical protein